MSDFKCSEQNCDKAAYSFLSISPHLIYVGAEIKKKLDKKLFNRFYLCDEHSQQYINDRKEAKEYFSKVREELEDKYKIKLKGRKDEV